MISEMSAEPFNNVSGEFLIDARQYAAEGLYTASLQKYFIYFSKTPKHARAENSESEFVDLLCDLDIFFQDKEVIGELIKCFLYSFIWFPKNPKLNNKFGILMSKDGEHRQALRYVLRAYKFAVERGEPLIAIEKNILHLIWTQVPRWHFRMLNGKIRNESYKAAIHKALDKGFTNVVDIGAGCGLLSLYAGLHESSPHIVAFESNVTLFRKGVTLFNNYSVGEPNYVPISRYSYEINRLEVGLRNLLITEIFDVAVFGEGILKSLKHAFKNLMVNKNFAVIPAGVTLYVTGVSCKNLDRKFRLYNKNPHIASGNMCVTKLTEDDPYDAEVLLHEQYEILTETSAFMKVSLANEIAIDYLLDEKLNFIVNLDVLKDGVVDSLVVWFDLHLDSEIIISTNPFHTQNEPCWEQAIFHCKHPATVSVDKGLQLKVWLKNEHLNFDFLNPPACDSFQCFKLTEQAIQFLNDEKWIEYLIAIADTIPDSSKALVVDFSAFPLMGILLAKKGYEVYHFYKEEKDLKFIEQVLLLNDVDFSLITFVDYDSYPELLLSLEKIDYLMFEPILQDGSLNYSPLDNVVFRRFKPEYFVQDVVINFVLINSSYLDYCNLVNKDNVQPFDELAKEMNEFTGIEHPCLSHDFPHEKMSSEHTWNFAEKASTIETLQALKDGSVNGILTWFTVSSKEGLQFCTKESTYFNKSVLIFPKRRVESEEAIKILCQYEGRGAFKIEICQDMWLRTNFERVSNTSYMAEFLENNACE